MYREEVLKRARKLLDDAGQKNVQLCVDTVRASEDANLEIEKAAEHVVDDSLYWAGYF